VLAPRSALSLQEVWDSLSHPPVGLLDGFVCHHCQTGFDINLFLIVCDLFYICSFLIHVDFYERYFFQSFFSGMPKTQLTCYLYFHYSKVNIRFNVVQFIAKWIISLSKSSPFANHLPLQIISTGKKSPLADGDEWRWVVDIVGVHPVAGSAGVWTQQRHHHHPAGRPVYHAAAAGQQAAQPGQWVDTAWVCLVYCKVRL